MTTELLTAARSVLRRITRRRPEHPDPWIAKGLREGWIRPGNGKPLRDDFFTFDPGPSALTLDEWLREERGR